MKLNILLILTILTCSLTGNPQESKIRLIPQDSYFTSYWNDTRDLVLAPAKWDKKDWLTAGAITTGGIALYIVDAEIQKIALRNQSAFSKNASKYVFEPFGHGYYPAAIVGGFYFYGLAKKDHRAYNFALTTTKAAIINGAITLAVKHLSHRQRPSQGIPPSHSIWKGPFNDFENTSFFSGHTVIAWTFATALATEYNDYPWVPWVSYSMATIVSLSRIHDNKHWASDVFIGGAFAYFSTRFICKKTSLKPLTQSRVVPVVNTQYGIMQYGVKIRL